jgi:hypothetical protein
MCASEIEGLALKSKEILPLPGRIATRSPSGGHAGVREVELGGQGRPTNQRGGGGSKGGVACDNWCVLSSQKTPPYIVGGGVPYPLPKAALGRQPREERAA